MNRDSFDYSLIGDIVVIHWTEKEGTKSCSRSFTGDRARKFIQTRKDQQELLELQIIALLSGDLDI